MGGGIAAVIVIYAPYPAPRLVRGGWMRRIAAIEDAFADRERVYVWPVGHRWLPDPRDYRPREERPAEGATFLTLDLRFSNQVRRLSELIDEADFVYAHTSHSARHLLPYYDTGKIVTDLHGIAPEEERNMGKPGRAAFFEALEETMVRKSARLVAVTQAMIDHLCAKYPGLDTECLLLPIVDDVKAPPRRSAGSRPRVVYAGGTQAWQNLGEMLDAVAALRGRCDFRFYTDDVTAVRKAARERGIGDALLVESLSPERLVEAYGEADFGFVLRDDIAVNRVSCPTKLSEYLACGVVPVVKLASIGDFERLGYRYVRIEDFLAGRLPPAAEAEEMRKANLRAFDAMRRAFREGVEALRSLAVAPSGRSAVTSATMTSTERCAIYPLHGMSIRATGDAGEVVHECDDVAGPRVFVEFSVGSVRRLRRVDLRLGEAPVIATPIAIEAVTRDGILPIRLRRGVRTDRFGNWLFDGLDMVVESEPLDVDGVSAIRCRFEILLAGPEVHAAIVPGACEPRGLLRRWADRARRKAHAVYRRIRG
ncbi:MAG: hypothetical protein Fur0037_00730 [Planctomycetota bacterium]